ncbi:MAG TPA: BTAD domain-containing putative transcriptional regulator [Thermodesulfobacteriota bacterium]|nr:BTAD domain-containing putative transcriptional regulator [Thermodesulfobacteriota bacterium]
MKSFVNISKISPPVLPRILDRSRLLDLLERNKNKKLILILGRAAQGKSTLAASYVRSSKTPFAWINLAEEDSDPVNLFYLMGQSLQHALKEIDLSRLLSYPSGVSDPMSEMAFFREWTHSLFEIIPTSIQIVMDGLDRLFPEAPAFKLLQILVEEAQPNVCLIMLSREIPPPPFEFQHLKVRQEAFILTNEELAFTPAEIRDYFQKVQQISLNPDQLKMILSSTEGWVGGLVLLSEFINRFSETSKKRLLPADLPDHFRREVFQYFGKEIFSSQPKQVQQFLIKSSIFDPIEPGFIKDLIGGNNTTEILREFSRRNLFVQSIYDSKKGWLFRYHQLFRDYLSAKLESEIDAEERKSLLVKAATLYEEKGDLENSVKYFLEAKAHLKAMSIIERVGMNLLKMGRKTDLSLWVTALPEDLIQSNPWLLFYLAMARRFTDVKENISSLWKALTLFKEKGIINGHMLSLAYLIENVIHIGHYHSVPVGSLMKEGQAILQSLKSESYAYERAVLWLQLGLARIRTEGNVRDGVSACETAYLIALQLKDLSLQANALIFSIFGLAYLGEFSLADKHYAKLDRLLTKMVNPELRAIQFYSSIILSTNRGDFGKALESLNTFKNFIEKYGFIFLYPRDLYYRSLMKVFLREYAEAKEIANVLLDKAKFLGGPFFEGLSYGVLALCHYYQGEYKKARGFVEQSINVLSSEEAKSEIHLYWHKQLAGFIHYHLHDYRAAEKELEETLDYFGQFSGYVSLAGSHFAMALLKFQQENKNEASNHLRMGFQIAEKKKYEHFIFLSPEDLVRTCVLALEIKVPEAIVYAAHLLSTRLSTIAEDDLKKLSGHPDSEVREKALRIRKSIHRSKVPSLRIETFGGFRVFRAGLIVEEKEWDRTQPKQLLKAIVSHGTQGVPKETILDALWPEEDFGASEKNFKTTLQRLRRSLESVIHKDFGSSYIHLHGNFISLDPELCQVDMNQFLSLLKKGEAKEKKGDIRAALSSYSEAIDLYRGDFLPEEIYAPWADLKREELRQKYIEFLNRMGELYEKQGAVKKSISCYKKMIEADPLLEESYQKLMILYYNKGMYNEALRAFKACEKALDTDLKSKPISTTLSLNKKVLEKLRSK